MFGLRLGSRPPPPPDSTSKFQAGLTQSQEAELRRDGPRCFEVWAISFAHLSTLPRLLERSILAGKVVSYTYILHTL